MTDASAPGPKNAPAGGRTKNTTVDARTELDAEQERAVRMRYGFAVPGDLALPQKGDGQPEVLAQLRAIEQRAFQESGRYAELAAEAGVDLDDPEQAAGQAIKRKIIDRLKPSSDD